MHGVVQGPLCETQRVTWACFQNGSKSAGHESIRRALVENSPAFAARCKSKPDAAKELLQNIIALMHDRSWRVRYCAATQVEKLAEAYGADVTRCAKNPCLFLFMILAHLMLE
jgi:hypothetical protein